uniref:Integrase catalytic domain-containing protein n=1 Tax=Fagus sylvatica TaxID=28930 RepID=A0A2N9GB44_FAGSY
MLQNALEGSGGSAASSAYTEAYRLIMRFAIGDKSFVVRIAAARCLKAFANIGGPGLGLGELDNSASYCALDDPVSSVRDAFAEALGSLLALGMNPEAQVQPRGKGPFPPAKKLEGGLQRHLALPFAKGNPADAQAMTRWAKISFDTIVMGIKLYTLSAVQTNMVEYLEVSEFHSGARKGVIRIPAGIGEAGPVTKPVGPVTRPVSRQEWRPKTHSPQAFHKADSGPEVSTKASSSTVESSSSLENIPDPVAALPTPEDADDEEGMWVMQLRQGKRLFMPQPPPLPLSPNPFYALSTELFTESSETIEIPEVWKVDDPAHISSLIVSDQLIGGDDGVEDEQVEWIEPLAVAYPAVEWNGETEVQEVSVQSEVPEVVSGPQSDWVMEKMEEFGVVLGASYVGFEDRVLALLREIEAETGGSKPGGVPETKLMAVTQGLIRSLWRCRYVDWLSLDSVGASGGIILMWDKRVVDRVDVAIGNFSVSCRFREVATGFEWAFSGVYGPNRAVERSLMWEELAGIASWWEVPWCVGGDFNIVRYPSERVGATDFSPSMREFTDFIFSMGLLDLPMDGGNFTWSNARSRSRLDRFLCSPLLADHFFQDCSEAPAQGLFSDDEVRRPLLDGVVFSTIDESDRDMLDRAFTEDEVWGVVRNMGGDKAPGPDGFSLAFFQSCWDIIKQDVMNVFHDFHTSRNFVKSLNVTFLALIPKKPGAQECKDFRPISLVTGMYKIIAKVLANRLSGVLPKLISVSQNAFVGGRQILDSEMASNGYTLVLPQFRFSVLVNGSAHGFFSTSRGLRQGDPLSPMLFIIVMEALSRMLERAVTGGYISGFSVGNSTGVELSISHSLFADDTLIFCGADSEQALEEEHKFHLVNWHQVCTPLSGGGLGIRDVAIFNKALLGKWLWRYSTEPNSLWRQVIDSKYGGQGNFWVSNRVNTPHGVSLWRHIRAGWDVFSQHISYTVGDGSRLRFWHDVWCGDLPLRSQFPSLFQLARAPEASVADLCHFQDFFDLHFLPRHQRFLVVLEVLSHHQVLTGGSRPFSVAPPAPPDLDLGISASPLAPPALGGSWFPLRTPALCSRSPRAASVSWSRSPRFALDLAGLLSISSRRQWLLVSISSVCSRSRSALCFAGDLLGPFSIVSVPPGTAGGSRFSLDPLAPPALISGPQPLSCSLPVDQVLISKTEYDSLLQRANASSSLLIASGNTCLHSSSSPSWVIDSGASDHMTGNSSLLSHTSSPCSPSFVTVANGTKTPVQGKGTVTTSNLTLSDVLYLPEFPFNLLSVHKLTLALNCSVAFYPSHCEFQDLKTKRMIGGGFVKDGLYYFQPSSTSIPSALHSTNSPYQWHCRLGHPSSVNLKHLVPTLPTFSNFNCETCELSKHHRATFKLRTDDPCLHPFELVHSDIWGPARTTGLCDARYFVTFIDDHSRLTWVYVLKDRSQLFSVFQSFYAEISNQFNAKLLAFRTDNAREYLDKRKNGPILAIARALMLQMNVPKLFWADAVLTAAYLLNRMPSRILKGKSPFEMFFPGKNPFSVPPRVFGCVSFVHNHSPNRDKLDPRAHKISHIILLKGRQLQESMLSAPVIPTHVPIAPPTSPISIVPPVPPISQVYVRRRNQDVPLIPPPPPVEFSLPLPPSASPSADSPPPQSTSDLDLPIAIRKGKRTCTEHPISNCVSFDHLSPSFKAFSLSLSSLVVPKSYREALSHPGWRKAMEEEMHALELNHTWDLIPKPAGTSIVGCRWVFTVKQNPDGTVDRLKARLVAKGFTQTYGLDYTETFSPVAKLNSIRIIISLAANLDWPLHQLDVKNAFLHGDLTETVYMTQPPGFESKGECVCHLKKSIYGLKQSPRAWFDKFSKAVVSHGMTRSQADHSVFFKKTRTGIVILVVYVDDIVITGSDKEGIQIFDQSSQLEVFSLKTWRKYTLDILQDTGYLGSKPVATPMEPNLKLMPDEGDFVDDPDTYRRLVGKLIYLTITRPDISYAVSIVSQFMTNPRVPHMNAVIRILKYLKNAPGRGLFYRSSGHLRIEGYTDADWAGSPSDRKSTTGYCTFIGGNLVTWRSKKQSVVARSSAEAEYRAMAHTTCELTWLRTVLQEFGLLTQGPTPLYCDNQAAIHIASNPVFHERTKHIEVDCHFVRSKVESKDIITPFVPSGSQLADIFTKALPKNAIDSICSKLGDWELEMIDSFMTLLYSSRIRQGVADSLCWTPSSRGLFEVRSFYSVLMHPSSQDYFPWKGVWKAKVPPRVAFFVWTSALGKILTTDNLRKRRLWSVVLTLFGITWVMPRGVGDLLSCWHGPRNKSEAGKIWKMTPHCLLWCIWQERNDRTFNGVEKSIPALKLHLLHTLLSWAKASHLDSSCSLSDMIDYCSACL